MIVIWSNNIRSVLKPENYFKLNWALKEEKPEIILLQETWLTDDKPFSVDGYKTYRRDSTTKMGHRGLITLVRNDLKNAIIKLNDISFDQTEILSVELQSNPPLIIHNVYHPPEIKATTWKIKSELGTLIAGDINGHHPTWSNGNKNTTGISFYNWSLEAAMKVINNPQQHTRPLSLTSPDIVALDNTMEAEVKIMRGWGSDHQPLKIIIEEIKTQEQHQKTYNWKWKWHCADWEYYRRILQAAAPKLEHIKTVQKLGARINNEILKAAGRAIPGYNKEVGGAFTVRDPELEELMTETDPDKTTTDAIAEGIRKVKQNIIECDMSGKDYRWAFRKVKQLEGRTIDHAISNITHKGRELTDSQEIANAFTETYANQFPKDGEMETISERPDENDEEFGMSELVRQLTKTKEKKAPGPDKIWNSMIKQLPEAFLKQLLRLFNLSWQRSAVPRCWKSGMVIPILKPDKDKKQVLSYRPITLTSSIAKLFERMIVERMHHLLNKTMNPRQAAYKRGRDATENLCIVTDRLLSARDRGKEAILITFDLQKAFDAVQPKTLMDKMMTAGLPTRYLRWVQNYLTGRKITTRVNGTKGNFQNIQVGVPQGSVLGPQLFSIFINDLIEKMEKFEPTVFADDVGIVIASDTINRLEDRVNEAVRIFEEWALDSQIKINKNPGKTEYIHVKPNRTQDKSPVVVYSEEHTFKYVVATAEQIRNLVKDDGTTTVEKKEDYAVTHLYVVPPHRIKTKLPNKPTVIKTLKMNAQRFPQLKKVHNRGEIDKMLETVGPGLHGFALATGRKVHKSKVVRYLGVHYDENLTFESQMGKMMIAASRGLGLLTRLTRIGCRKRTLISILVTVVLARILYGVESFAWVLASNFLQQLELIINRTVRLVTGCLRSTELTRLYEEADTPRLKEHIQYKMCRTYERFKLSPHLPAHELTKTKRMEENPPKTIWGWTVWNYYVSGIPGLDINRSIISQEVNPEHYTLPPWKETNAMKFTYPGDKDEAKRSEADLPAQDTRVYTDGSIRHKSKTYMTKAAAAVVIVDKGKTCLLGYKIPVAGSSYRTEQIAVKLAMENLVQAAKEERECPTATTHLLTDSMSVMQALEQGPYKQRSPMNKDIWKLAMKLERKGVQINVQYVPAHRNVRYNEVADQIAKYAAGLKDDPPYKDVIIKQLPAQLDMGTMMTFHKRRKRENWLGPGEVRHPPYIDELTRPEEVIMSRFRVGHCRSLKLKGQNEKCIFCKDARATPHHVALLCEHWCVEFLRDKYIDPMINEEGEEPCSLEDCYLPNNQRKMLNFVTALDELAVLTGR